MKKIKLFSLFAAILFAGSAMAANPVTPTTVYTVGDATTLQTSWSSKSQLANNFVSGDTVIFQAYVCYSSASSSGQTWLGYTDNGSGSTTWSATECFKGAAAWFGETSSNHKYAGTRNNRAYLFNVTNCVSVLFYGNPSNANRSITANVYELGTDNKVATDAIAVKTATITGATAAVGKIEGLDGSKAYQIKVLGNDGSNGQFYEIAFVATPAAKDIATLNSITVNGEEVKGFAPETTEYDVVLSFGTTEVPVVAATATSSNATVSVTPAESVDGTATITVTAEDGTTKKTYTINFTVADPNQDATLSAITVDGEALEGFDPEQLTYSMELAYGTSSIPNVTATTTDENATSIVKYVDAEGAETTSLPCTATITVTAEDTEVSQTYSIAFTVAASASTDATLASISIDGTAIADFKADLLDYTHTIAYAATTIPKVTAVAHDETANINITQADAVPGTATIVVTAQASNTLTYTVAIKRAAAIKHLTVVPFTNGAKGAIDETALTVTAPYLDGTNVPTVKEEEIKVSGDGTPTATLSEDGATITLKGDDEVEAFYTVVTKALTPNTMTANEVTFTGEETYIFAPYGFDTKDGRGWKFAKKVNDESNMRDASGNTRIYMALPPAESVKLTSGTSARAVVIYVNGAKSDVTQTAASGSTITLALNSTTNNFVAIESNQTSGDGGFTKIQLVNPSNPIGSAVEQAQVAVKAVKVIRDGQLLIIREGKTYTAQGMELR